jgi:hypothetical protein
MLLEEEPPPEAAAVSPEVRPDVFALVVMPAELAVTGTVGTDCTIPAPDCRVGDRDGLLRANGCSFEGPSPGWTFIEPVDDVAADMGVGAVIVAIMPVAALGTVGLRNSR